MFTIAQCRGARGILGWTQQDLADASGLSKTAINNFEKGHSDIKSESLRAIRMAFENANIEFIGIEGVSKKTESFKILRGENSLSDLLEDMYQTLTQKDGDILISFVGHELAERLTTKKLFNHIDFLKNNDLNQRILSFAGSNNVLSPTEECRWINEECADIGTTTFIYADKIAHQLWDQSTIIVTHSAEAANAERARFEKLWQDAIIPDATSVNSQKLIQSQQQKSGTS